MLLPEHTALILNDEGVERMIRALLIARRDAQRYEKYHERTREDIQFYSDILRTLGYIETNDLTHQRHRSVYEQFIIGPIEGDTSDV